MRSDHFQNRINDINICFSEENFDVFDYKSLITFEVSIITFLCVWLFLL
jgi:hypothetical protein